MMEMQERLVSFIERTYAAINYAACAVQLKALNAPRPLRDVPQKYLDKNLTKHSLAVVVAAYKLWSNKSTNVGLKDRQLNKLGRVAAIADIVLGVPVVLLLIHERWVRSETPMSFDQFMNQLLHGENLMEDFLR